MLHSCVYYVFYLILLLLYGILSSSVQLPEDNTCSSRLTSDDCLQIAIRMDEFGIKRKVSCFYCTLEQLPLNSSVQCKEAKTICELRDSCQNLNFLLNSDELISAVKFSYHLLDPTLFEIRQVALFFTLAFAYCYYMDMSMQSGSNGNNSYNHNETFIRALRTGIGISILLSIVQCIIYWGLYPVTMQQMFRLCPLYDSTIDEYTTFRNIFKYSAWRYFIIARCYFASLCCMYSYRSGYFPAEPFVALGIRYVLFTPLVIILAIAFDACSIGSVVFANGTVDVSVMFLMEVLGKCLLFYFPCLINEIDNQFVILYAKPMAGILFCGWIIGKFIILPDLLHSPANIATTVVGVGQFCYFVGMTLRYCTKEAVQHQVNWYWEDLVAMPWCGYAVSTPRSPHDHPVAWKYWQVMLLIGFPGLSLLINQLLYESLVWDLTIAVLQCFLFIRTFLYLRSRATTNETEEEQDQHYQNLEIPLLHHEQQHDYGDFVHLLDLHIHPIQLAIALMLFQVVVLAYVVGIAGAIVYGYVAYRLLTGLLAGIHLVNFSIIFFFHFHPSEEWISHFHRQSNP